MSGCVACFCRTPSLNGRTTTTWSDRRRSRRGKKTTPPNHAASSSGMCVLCCMCKRGTKCGAWYIAPNIRSTLCARRSARTQFHAAVFRRQGERFLLVIREHRMMLVCVEIRSFFSNGMVMNNERWHALVKRFAVTAYSTLVFFLRSLYLKLLNGGYLQGWEEGF